MRLGIFFARKSGRQRRVCVSFGPASQRLLERGVVALHVAPLAMERDCSSRNLWMCCIEIAR